MHKVYHCTLYIVVYYYNLAFLVEHSYLEICSTLRFNGHKCEQENTKALCAQVNPDHSLRMSGRTTP